ncbi:MAG: D-glycero-beta-D-manno-heptose-7-phosphate kinase [Bacteroidetes bacterium]|nr:MAG: D-glycero-beta-D-manno-heptose-7-phosphate kinase [Bacteroidota bacterium]
MLPDIPSFLSACRNLRILVIGDLMLDRYVWGRVERISPEAPVPVVDVYEEEDRPGGAANVGLNLQSLGATALLCGLAGTDPAGEDMLRVLEDRGFDTRWVLRSPERRSTVKTRIMGNKQQALRIDREDKHPSTLAEQEAMLRLLQPALDQADAVLFEDYDKGAIGPELIEAVIRRAQERNIPVTVDPKFRHFFHYAQCSLFKPNLKEINEALNLRLRADQPEALAEAVLHLRERMPHRRTLITLGEYGMLLVDEEGNFTQIAAHHRSVADVSGAGDTVISVVTLALAAGYSWEEAAELANLAGGLVCESLGVVPIRPEQLMPGRT